MRTLAAVLLAAVVVFILPGRPTTAQEKKEKPAVVKWEYAELTYRTTPARGATKDADGNEVPARESTATIVWTTGAEEDTLKGWGELADKLKAPFKKDASAAGQRLQALNALGAAGWEIVEQQVATSSTSTPAGRAGAGQPAAGPGGPSGFTRVTTGTLLFKRRVP